MNSVVSPLDFERHNDEVRQVWDAYREGNPIRVPIVIGANKRYTMDLPEANPRGLGWPQLFSDPHSMIERELEHQLWVRTHIPQDAEMGPPPDGWNFYLDYLNVYDAAWFGAPIHFYDHEVPDTTPILADEDSKRKLFDTGIPDLFAGGFQARVWEAWDYAQELKRSGWTFAGVPIGEVNVSGYGCDGPLTVCCNLRGATEFLTDLAMDEEYADELLAYVTEACIARMAAYRERLGHPAKAQGHYMPDDSIQLISETMYVERILPHHKRFMEAFSLGGPNGFHLCGDATRHFATIQREMNVQWFDTGFPVDFGALRRKLGPDCEILGGPSVPFMMTASPDEVRSEVKRVLDTGVMDGKFVLREGNNLPPNVGMDKVMALIDAGKEFGRYR